MPKPNPTRKASTRQKRASLPPQRRMRVADLQRAVDETQRRFKLGATVSVWYRESGRHKWRCEFSFVRLIRVDTKGATVQTSETLSQKYDGFGIQGPTSFCFRGVGDVKSCRELREPVLWNLGAQ